MGIVYQGYVPEGAPVQHIADALAWYQKKTGHDATVIVVREDAPEIYDTCPILVRSRKGMGHGMLITHLVGPDAINTPHRRELEDNWNAKLNEIPDLPISTKNLFLDSPRKYEAPNRMPGRPQRGGGICPHCHAKVSDFNLLGWWWGWEKGIYPPYWEELCDYVFQRDNYTCAECKKRFGRGQLVAHHIKHKEDGGDDSARNIATMCRSCHPDGKPIFSDSEE